MYGYKSGITEDGIRVLISLYIPMDAKTNFERKNVKNKLFAKYRVNKATVLRIQDDNLKSYVSAKSLFSNEKIKYVVGGQVISNFNDNIEIVNSEGIHLFLDNEVAINYGRKIFTQIWKHDLNLFMTFFNNGNTKERINYLYDNTTGFYNQKIELFFENGKHKLIENIRNNQKNGLCTKWYHTGKVKSYCEYEDGLKNGIERIFFANAHRKFYITYVKGILDGKFTSWHMNGNIEIDCNYSYGILCDDYKKYDKNGKLIFYKKYPLGYYNIKLQENDAKRLTENIVNEIFRAARLVNYYDYDE
jgi:antitoxin component YwqK of YwqJK toxin-antitoxin module